MLIDLDPSNVVVPFPIERFYFVIGASGTRGGHTHHKLRQLAFCMQGSCTFVLDSGAERWEVHLSGDQGVLLEPMIWHDMKDFSPDCLLGVVASDVYDENDYIRDYGEFRRLVEERNSASAPQPTE